jgi:hypothetical protein
MQEEGGSQGARFARHIAMQAAVAPEQVKVPDFLVAYLHVVGAVEPAQDATAIEPALPDDFVDDVGINETPKRSPVKQAHQFARLTAFGIRHEYRQPKRVAFTPWAGDYSQSRADERQFGRPFRKTRWHNVTEQWLNRGAVDENFCGAVLLTLGRADEVVVLAMIDEPILDVCARVR